MIEGYDYVPCDDCNATIPLENWDASGPDDVQPDGFKCADHWICNACGDRESMTCCRCQAIEIAEEALSDALYAGGGTRAAAEILVDRIIETLKPKVSA